jgi:hypothetical protein
MKKEVVEFVYACLTCQKTKIEHQTSSGLMQPLSNAPGPQERGMSYSLAY